MNKSRLVIISFLALGLVTPARAQPETDGSSGTPVDLACISSMISLRGPSEIVVVKAERQDQEQAFLNTFAIQYPVLFTKTFDRVVQNVLSENKVNLAQSNERVIYTDKALVMLIWNALAAEYIYLPIDEADPLSARLENVQKNGARARKLGMTLTELETTSREIAAIRANPALNDVALSVLQKKLPEYAVILEFRARSGAAKANSIQSYSSKDALKKTAWRVGKRSAIGVGAGVGALFLTQSYLSFEIAAFAPLVYESLKVAGKYAQSQVYKVNGKWAQWRFKQTAGNLDSGEVLPALPPSRFRPKSLIAGPPELTSEQVKQMTPSLDQDSLESILRFGGGLIHNVASKTRAFTISLEALKVGAAAEELNATLTQLSEEAQSSRDGSIAKGRVHDYLLPALNNYLQLLIGNANSFTALKSDSVETAKKLEEFLVFGAQSWQSFRAQPGSEQKLVSGASPMNYLEGRLKDLNDSKTLASQLGYLIDTSEATLVGRVAIIERIKVHLTATLQDGKKQRYSAEEVKQLLADLGNLGKES